jgi:exonuclease III
MAAKIAGILEQCSYLQLDIVAIMETHASFVTRVQLQHMLMREGWCSFWSLGGQTKSAGIAILIRNSLLASGRLQLRGDPTPGPNTAGTRGRLLRVPILWGRQPIDIVGVYMHASAYQPNVAMIQTTLKEWHDTAPSGNLVVMGDFNFVHCADLDRRQPSAMQLQPPALTAAPVPATAPLATRDTAPARA